MVVSLYYYLEATGAEVLHLSADGLNLVACKIVYFSVIGSQVFVTKTFSNKFFCALYERPVI